MGISKNAFGKKSTTAEILFKRFGLWPLIERDLAATSLVRWQ